MKGYIYKITNTINNKCYIGQTRTDINKRWNQHKFVSTDPSNKAYNYPLYNAFRKYGIDNFKWEILEELDDNLEDLIVKLNNLEIYYISKYDSLNNGYNQNKGGNIVVQTLENKYNVSKGKRQYSSSFDRCFEIYYMEPSALDLYESDKLLSFSELEFWPKIY